MLLSLEVITVHFFFQRKYNMYSFQNVNIPQFVVAKYSMGTMKGLSFMFYLFLGQGCLLF